MKDKLFQQKETVHDLSLFCCISTEATLVFFYLWFLFVFTGSKINLLYIKTCINYAPKHQNMDIFSCLSPSVSLTATACSFHTNPLRKQLTCATTDVSYYLAQDLSTLAVKSLMNLSSVFFKTLWNPKNNARITCSLLIVQQPFVWGSLFGQHFCLPRKSAIRGWQRCVVTMVTMSCFCSLFSVPIHSSCIKLRAFSLLRSLQSLGSSYDQNEFVVLT